MKPFCSKKIGDDKLHGDENYNKGHGYAGGVGDNHHEDEVKHDEG